MAATQLNVTTLPGAFSRAAIQALFQASDPVNGNSFLSTSKEILLAWNTATGTNEIQTITSTATGGTVSFSFTYGGITYTTAAIAFNASAATVAAAVLAATGTSGHTLAQDYPAGVITGGGGPLGTAGVTLTFTGTFADQALSALVPNNASLTGGTATVVRTTPGTGLATLSVTSAPDSPSLRVGNLGPTNVPIGQIFVTQMFPSSGWAVSSLIVVTTSASTLQLAVLTLP